MSRMTGRAAVTGSGAVLSALAVLVAFAPPALATSPPAWELSSSHMPAEIPLTEPVDQVDTVTVFGEGSTPYVGHFSLEVENGAGEEGQTRQLRYAASAAAVRAALEDVKIVGHGNVKVTGGPQRAGGSGQMRWSYVVTFIAALAGRELALNTETFEATEAEEEAVERAGGVSEEGSVAFEVTTHGERDTVEYELIATNIGGAPTSGSITVTDTLPAGLSTKATPEGKGWTCTPPGEAQTRATCTSEAVVEPGAKASPITIEAYVDTAKVTEGEQLVNRATISGGGALAAAEATDTATTGGVAVPSSSPGGGSGGGGSGGGGSGGSGSGGGGVLSDGDETENVSSAQIAALLVGQLTPAGTAARITALLKRGGFTVAFKALEAGTAVIDWYEVSPGAKLAKKTKPKPVLVGVGRLRFSAAGTAKIRIRLTVAGRRLLRHARQLRLTAKGTFTPTGKTPITAKRTFVLKR